MVARRPVSVPIIMTITVLVTPVVSRFVDVAVGPIEHSVDAASFVAVDAVGASGTPDLPLDHILFVGEAVVFPVGDFAAAEPLFDPVLLIVQSIVE